MEIQPWQGLTQGSSIFPRKGRCGCRLITGYEHHTQSSLNYIKWSQIYVGYYLVTLWRVGQSDQSRAEDKVVHLSLHSTK